MEDSNSLDLLCCFVVVTAFYLPMILLRYFPAYMSLHCGRASLLPFPGIILFLISNLNLSFLSIPLTDIGTKLPDVGVVILGVTR